MEQQKTYQLSKQGHDFIEKCIKLLEDGGLMEVGIYRVSGFVTSIEKLLTLGLSEDQCVDVFNNSEYAELITSKTLTGAVKSYIRNLQEPLITNRLFPYFMDAGKIEDETKRIEEVQQLVWRLPIEHMEMLRMLTKHLLNVALQCKHNKMDVFNLAVVWGPSIMRSPDDCSFDALFQIRICNLMVENLITYHDAIFTVEPSRTSKCYATIKKIRQSNQYMATRLSSPTPPTPKSHTGLIRFLMVCVFVLYGGLVFVYKRSCFPDF